MGYADDPKERLDDASDSSTDDAPDDAPDDEPVEDFAAAGTAPPEEPLTGPAAWDDEADEVQRHSQPDQL